MNTVPRLPCHLFKQNRGVEGLTEERKAGTQAISWIGCVEMHSSRKDTLICLLDVLLLSSPGLSPHFGDPWSLPLYGDQDLPRENSQYASLPTLPVTHPPSSPFLSVLILPFIPIFSQHPWSILRDGNRQAVLSLQCH